MALKRKKYSKLFVFVVFGYRLLFSNAYIGAATVPDYTKVFPQDKVNRIDIVIDAETWEKMLKDMESHFGELGKGMMMPPPFRESDSLMGGHPPMPPPAGGEPMFGERPFMPSQNPGDTSKRPMFFPGRGKMPPMSSYAPAYSTCTLTFEEQQWHSVGIRFKGNSSLMSSWHRGIKKFPFRLDFGKFKDASGSKSFFGFRELSFSSNNDDKSLLREKITADIFRESGIKAPRTAFYRVFVDYGEGPKYFGLYTAVEIVEDTMLKNQFGDDSGNCYKPEGPAAAFTGTFETNSFEKKTNKKKSDWSDIKNLFSIINSDVRTSNAAQWKHDLEQALDVPVFMKWLAINNTIRNWDTYGSMAHNYYLFHNPSSQKFVWIPWDNNEALMDGKGKALTLSLKEVTNDWPLIRYLMDQPAYAVLYRASMKELIEGVFNPDRIKQEINAYSKLITPYVIGENGEQAGFTFLNNSNDFTRAIEDLKKHIETRNQKAKAFLSSEGM